MTEEPDSGKRSCPDDILQFFTADLAIPQDLMQEAWPDYLAGVNWHNGVPAVCMPKEMMTTPYPYGLKSGFSKCGHQSRACYARSPAHAATATVIR